MKQLGGFVCSLLVLISSACAPSEDHSSETWLEFRIVHADEECSECMQVRFKNLYNDSDLLFVNREPDFVLGGSLTSVFESIEVKDSTKGKSAWKVRVELAGDQTGEAEHFRQISDSMRTPVLVSVKGRPIDVITIGQVVSVMLIGSFHSEQELRSVIPGTTPSSESIHIDSDQAFSKKIRRWEAELAREIRDQEILQDAIDALQQENLEEVDGQLDELQHRSASGGEAAD